jgi:hypothetical protein
MYRHSLTEAERQVQKLTHIGQTLTHRGQNTNTNPQKPEYRYKNKLTEVRIQVETPLTKVRLLVYTI